jgi:hypothetical protein
VISNAAFSPPDATGVVRGDFRLTLFINSDAQAQLSLSVEAVATGQLGYQFHRDHRGPGTHPAQAPPAGRRRGQGAPQATSVASLPSTETRTVGRRRSGVGPTSPVEIGDHRRWLR